MELEASESNVHVDEKKRNFYENLFTKEEGKDGEATSKRVKKPRAKLVKKQLLAEGENATKDTEITVKEAAAKVAEGGVITKVAKKGGKSTDADAEATTPAAKTEKGEKTKSSPKVGKNAKSGFKQKLENLKQKKTQEEQEREK